MTSPQGITGTRQSPYKILAGFLAGAIALFILAFSVSGGAMAPKLGIDLQGGTRVTLIPKGEPSNEDLEQAQTIIRDRVNGMGVSGTSVLIDGSNIVLTVPGEGSSSARDLGSTSKLTIRPVREILPAVQDDSKDTQRPSRRTTQQEIDAAIADRQALEGDKLTTRFQEFKCPQYDVLAGLDDPSLPLIVCTDQTKYLLEPVPPLEGEPTESPRRLSGLEIEKDSVTSGFNQQSSVNEVAFRFKAGSGETASQTWSKLTQKYLQKQIAILLDNKVISAPVVRGVTPTGSLTSITGDFTPDEARSLANNLRFGALPVSFEDPNVDNVPATLGIESLKAGLIAGGIGLLFVFLYCFAYYRLLGFITALSLIVSGALVYAVLVILGHWIGFTLDLAGVAGLIIGIGMTADSFVVFFERIKDEMREGHLWRSAVPRGWSSAKRTIWTGNAVSLIAAIVLYALAIGEVRGFAFTLGVTTVMDILIVFLVTWPLMNIASRKELFSRPSANGLGAFTRKRDTTTTVESDREVTA